MSQALVELVAEKLGQKLGSGDEGPEALEEAAPISIDGEITEGMDSIRRLVCVDQKPIGRTPRSNLATYTGLFDPVRRLFAATKAHAHGTTMPDASRSTSPRVIVVEHDMRVVAGSDWVIDIGPGAGEEGGQVVAKGTPTEVAKSPHSRTAPYLSRFLHQYAKKPHSEPRP